MFHLYTYIRVLCIYIYIHMCIYIGVQSNAMPCNAMQCSVYLSTYLPIHPSMTYWHRWYMCIFIRAYDLNQNLWEMSATPQWSRNWMHFTVMASSKGPSTWVKKCFFQGGPGDEGCWEWSSHVSLVPDHQTLKTAPIVEKYGKVVFDNPMVQASLTNWNKQLDARQDPYI